MVWFALGDNVVKRLVSSVSIMEGSASSVQVALQELFEPKQTLQALEVFIRTSDAKFPFTNYEYMENIVSNVRNSSVQALGESTFVVMAAREHILSQFPHFQTEYFILRIFSSAAKS